MKKSEFTSFDGLRIDARFNVYDGLPQRMPNMPKGEHSRASEKDVRQ